MHTQSNEPFLVECVLSLQPKATHLLKVMKGRAWVTLVGECDQYNPDIFLQEGEEVRVQAGQHVVMEAWARHAGDGLWVQWQIAYDAPIDLFKVQGTACPPTPPKLLPVKAI